MALAVSSGIDVSHVRGWPAVRLRAVACALSASVFYARRGFALAVPVLPWVRVAAEYTAANIASRLLAAVGALLLVRFLPVSEYAFYTLLLTAFTYICTFSDLGVTETLSYFRWRSTKTQKSWMPYFYAVVRFRRVGFMMGFLAGAAYVYVTGRHLGVAMRTIVPAIALMAFAWFSIQSSIISFALKLSHRFRSAYAVEFGIEGTKLVAITVICALGVATALAGMLSVAIGSAVGAVLATRLFGQTHCKMLQLPHRQRHHSNRVLRGQIAPTLPGTINSALQGPLVVSLAAYYGSAANVAEVGALSRLGVMISLISGFTGTIFVPRLIAIPDEVRFFRIYLWWWAVIGTFGGVVMLAISMFPEALLLILGSSYSGLHQELVTTAATAVCGAWAAFAWNVNRARGWIKVQSYSVPIIIAGQIGMFALLDLSVTEDVLLLSLGTACIGCAFQLIVNVVGFMSANPIGKKRPFRARHLNRHRSDAHTSYGESRRLA